VGGDRDRLAPRGTISKINVFTDTALGLSDMDRRRLRRAVAVAISDILRSPQSLCLQPPQRVCLSVSYLEQRLPVLASCDGSWGACAALSRSLVYRQQHVARKLKKLRNNAGAAGGKPKGLVKEVGDAQGLPLEERARHDFLSQVP